MLISKNFFVSTPRQCVVVEMCRNIKCCFIGWNIPYSFWNVIWQCLDDIRQMSEEFYPSITKHLLLKAIEHAKLYTSITQQELDIILHARKSLLFSKNKPWEKTINESLFDIRMGSYDGSEISLSVCIYYLFLGKYMEFKT